MRRAFLGIVLGVALATPAFSDSIKSMNLAMELGSVLAAENACGLKYDQAAIEAFIEKKVPEKDMSFPSTLNMMTEGQKVQIEEMSSSSKTAYCTQIKRIVKSYGFIK